MSGAGHGDLNTRATDVERNGAAAIWWRGNRNGAGRGDQIRRRQR
ncbi:hypothetical protein [Pantoea stewartii]